jgi:hypothetical protein
MTKTYAQEVLEIESARISADLAYQREREIVHNKPLFSKKEIDQVENKGYYFSAAAFVIGIIFGAIMIYSHYH